MFISIKDWKRKDTPKVNSFKISSIGFAWQVNTASTRKLNKLTSKMYMTKY